MYKNQNLYLMEIVHDEAKKQFKVEVDGYTAHVAYQLTEDGGLDIRHTIVPEEIGGQYQGDVSCDYGGKGTCAI